MAATQGASLGRVRSSGRDVETVLVVGGTGFIGRAVLRELIGELDGYRGIPHIRVLSRRPPARGASVAGTQYVTGDLTEASTLHGVCEGADVLVHTASYVGRDARKCHDVNDAGTQALLDEAQRAGVRRILYVSTASVYGSGHHRGLREGELEPSPASPASSARLRAERAVLAARGTVLRPHLVYGPGDRWFIPALVRVLSRVRAWPLSASSYSSLVEVGDVARVVASLVREPWQGEAAPTRGEVYHVAHPEPVRMENLVVHLCRLLDLPVPCDDVSPAGHRRLVGHAMPELSDHQHALLTQDHWYDSSRIWRRTGIDPRSGFEDGFARSAAWYRAHLAALFDA